MELDKKLETLTEAEVAQIFKCTAAALLRMRRERRGPQFFHVGRLVRYPVTGIEAFMRESSYSGTEIDTTESANGN